MKIATYNMEQGGKQRVHWARLIEDHGVDLLLVQESYAHHEHLPPLFYPGAGSRSAWEVVEGNRWGSGVFARSGTVTPVAVSGFTGWVVGAQIRGASWQAGASDSLLAFSVHAPTVDESYSKQVDKLLNEIKRIAAGREVVLGGDFNLTLSQYSGENRPVSKNDLAIQTRLTDEFQLLNCWDAANRGRPAAQTLRWRKDRTIPFHCDGIFVPKSWNDRLLSCSVLRGNEWDQLSDHNPVVADFS